MNEFKDINNNILKIGDKVKIIKCSKNNYWYKTRINEIFEVSGYSYTIEKDKIPIYCEGARGYLADKDDIIKINYLKNKIRKLKRLMNKCI